MHLGPDRWGDFAFWGACGVVSVCVSVGVCVCVFVFTFLLAPEFLNTLEVFVFVWHVGWGLREKQAGFSLRIHRVLCPLQSLQQHKDGSLYERRMRAHPPLKC